MFYMLTTMKRLIRKLNESVKYNINANNRNIVAAICLMEFDRLIKFAEYSEDFLLLKRYIDTLRYHLQSPIPMKLDFGNLPCHNICDMLYNCKGRFILYEDLQKILLENQDQGILLENQTL